MPEETPEQHPAGSRPEPEGTPVAPGRPPQASWPPPQPQPQPQPQPPAYPQPYGAPQAGWAPPAYPGGPPGHQYPGGQQYPGGPYGQPYAGAPYPGHPSAGQPYADHQYAVPPGTALPAFPHAEPTPYHQMLRTWTYRWWKPALGMVLAVFAGFVIAPIVLLPVLALGVWIEGGSFVDKFLQAAQLQTVTPSALLYLNLVLGSLILITWFVMRFIHRMRPRWLSSVVPRLRWRFLVACLGLAVIALVAQVVVGALLPGDPNGDFGKVNSFTTTTLVIAVVVFLTTPLQAAGEEYLFRGYLLMGVGSLFRSSTTAKWVAIVVTSTLFAIAHGGQNFPLFFDRFMFGLIAGWLVIRTGGLEAGIALHVLNNFLAYALALTFGDLTQTLTVSEASWWNIPLTLTQSLVYAGLVAWLAHRMGLQTRTRPPVAETEPEPAVAVV